MHLWMSLFVLFLLWIIDLRQTPVKPRRAVTKATERVYKRRPRNKPPTEEEMQVAQRRLQTARSTGAIGTNIHMPTLYALCEELEIPRNQGTHSTHGAGGVSEPDPRKSVVLSDSIIPEIWKDQECLQLPSFLSPGLPKFGSQRCTLSTDEWRSVGTIHLGQMLDNFMHLISAIHLANLRSISSQDIADYSFHMDSYLCGFSELYKEAKIQPTHHLSLHFSTLLTLFGPVHSWRAWSFEHYNYILQNIETNRKFGVKLSFVECHAFIEHHNRASNLAVCLLGSRIPGVLEKLWSTFQQTFHSDIHGTRLNDILAFGRSSGTRVHLRHSTAVGKQANEDNKHIQLALEYLGTRNISTILFCTKLQREGMVFQAVAWSPGDANVIVWDKHSREKCTAARILALFTDTTATTSPMPSFAVIERHVELNQKDQELDPYWHFGFPVAGALYYDKFHPSEVISSNKLVTQFAKTVFVHEPLNAEVTHVLPIFKTIHLAVEWHLDGNTSHQSVDEDGAE
ncbi:hypothetical protein F5141DRAFT_1066671 [Pisolithus sp. B1]|nr:hypothetical protein F5141DRAFT_1066671 [Pisolithus sp. B1]